MVAPATIIGRLGIRIHPISTGVRREAQNQLDRIEAQLDEIKAQMRLDSEGMVREAREAVRQAERAAGDVNVGVKVADASQDLRWLEQRLRSVERDLRLNLGLNKDQAERELEHLRDKYDGDKIEFDVKVANLKASLDLARISRDRNVTLFVTVSKKSMAAAATTLAALSGARLVGDQLDRLWQRIQDLDKSIPILSALASAFLGVAASVGASFSNLSAMVSSLAQIGPAVLALPGIMGGFAFGIGAAFAALKDFNDVLPEVGERFKNLQTAMSGRFWRIAEEPIRNMIDNLFPQLRRGLLATADGLGVFFSAFAEGMDSRLDGYLEPMFANLQRSMVIASGGADALAGAITTLGRTGSAYLPRLAAWFQRNVISFDRWLEQSYNSGALQGWIDRGIERMHQLWSATSDLAVIIYTLGVEAEKAGGAGLEQFAETMGRVRDVVESEAFLNSYRQFINASHDFFQSVNSGVSGRFGAYMHSFVDQMTTAFDNLGWSIGNFLGAFYDMAGGSAITRGWDALTSGLATGLDGFSKHMDDIGRGIGALQSIVGTMASRFLPILGSVFATLGRILADNGPAIERVIHTLADTFEDLVRDLEPIVERWFPRLIAVLQAVAPHADKLLILAAGLKAVKLASAGFGVVRGAAASISSLGSALAGSRAMTSISAALASWRSNPLLASANAGARLGHFVQNLRPILGMARAGTIIGAIGLAIKGMWDNSSSFRNGAKGLIGSLSELASTIASKFIFPQVEAAMDTLGDFWDFLTDFANWIKSGVGPILRNLGDNFGDILEQVTIVTDGLNDLLNGRRVDLSEFNPARLLGWDSSTNWDTFWNIPKTFGDLPKPAPGVVAAWTNFANIDIESVGKSMQSAAYRAARLEEAVEQGASTFFDLSEGVQDSELSLQGWMDTLRAQLDARAMWQSNLDKLRSMGLSDAAYEALAGLGEAGALRVQELVDAGAEGIEEFNGIIRDDLGKTATTVSGSLSGLPAAVKGAINIMNKAVASMGMDVGPWERMGTDAVSGFSRGMSGGIGVVAKTATTVAMEARKGISTNLDINSPSRVMYDLGRWAAQGFIDGLASLLTGTFSASKGLANEVIKGFKGSSGYSAGRTLAQDIRKGMYSYANAGTGSYVGGRIVAGLKGAGTYGTGRTIAYDLRRGMYSYPNAGTGNYVGGRIRAGLNGVNTYSTGRSLAADLRRGMYSYPNAGTGAEVARRARGGMRGFSAYSSGRALAGTFASGILSRVGDVRRAAKKVATAARNYFPNSPAKEGPFSGSGWIDKSGIAIGDTFAASIEAGVPKVRMAALAMADAASEVNSFNMRGLDAAISTDNQHVVSLANTPVTFMVDGRPMQAYIQEGVDQGTNALGQRTRYAKGR